MALEMVLNELSLRTPAADIPTARQLMSDFIRTVRTVKAQSGRQATLRTQYDFHTTTLASGYPLRRWLNDPEVDREEQRFIKTLATKAPFSNDILNLEIQDIENNLGNCEFRHQGEIAIGLGVAYLLDALSVSFLSEQRWDCSRIELAITRLENEDEEHLEIVHASRSNHVQEHADWIKNCIQSRVRDGLELWNRKDELFPNLIFCEVVGERVQSLGAENLMLQLVKNRLSELEDYCKIWTDEAFEPKSLRNVSPESQVTLQNPKYSKERTFLCPDGKERVFSWHAKLSFGWRIYFFPNEERKMIIGYVGCHLRTVKYSN
jgi:hypothetical protein